MASVKDLTRHGIELGNCKRISATDFEILKRQGCMPMWGDVLIAKDGNSALDTVCVHRLREDVVLLSSVAILRPNEKVDSDFLRYYLDAPQTRALLKAGFRSGSAIPRVVLKDFRRAPVTVPPLDEQRAIAHILGTLDDKIELNRRMNETLEAMARALFKSWFIDFDPVRAKAEGRDPGLPKHIAELFPDSFEDSELGEIPKGWRSLPLYETAKFINGAAFRSEDFCSAGEGLPVVKIAELKDGISAQTKWSQRQAGPDQLIDTGDMLYSWSGSPDTSLDVFLWTKGPGLLNQHIFKVVAPTNAQKRLIYYLLKYLRPTLVETARNKQTTGLGHVTVADMKSLLVCLPTKEILAAFDCKIAPIFDRAFANKVEAETLANLRDTLLPKLIAGEVRVNVMTKRYSHG